jgi:hypothetical protein
MNLLLIVVLVDRVPSMVFERRETIAPRVFDKADMCRSSPGLKVKRLRSRGGTSLERQEKPRINEVTYSRLRGRRPNDSAMLSA